MKLEELLEKPQKPPAQKEPTLAQYRELMLTLRQSIDKLQQEKAKLAEELQQALEEKKRQAQRISQLEKDLADQQLAGDDNTPQPSESMLPEEAQPTDPRIAYWKQKLHHPAAPIVIWGILTGLSLLSSTIRADFVQLGQTLKAAMCIVNDGAAELTADVSYPEIAAMLITSCFVTAIGLVLILVFRQLIIRIKANYGKKMKVIISAGPLLLWGLSWFHDTFQGINGFIVMAITQIVLILAISQPTNRKEKLKIPKKH